MKLGILWDYLTMCLENQNRLIGKSMIMNYVGDVRIPEYIIVLRAVYVAVANVLLLLLQA